MALVEEMNAMGYLTKYVNYTLCVGALPSLPDNKQTKAAVPWS